MIKLRQRPFLNYFWVSIFYIVFLKNEFLVLKQLQSIVGFVDTCVRPRPPQTGGILIT